MTSLAALYFPVFLILLTGAYGRSVVDGGSKGDEDAGILWSYMDIRVRNPTSTDMCIWCWSGDHDNDRQGCSKNDVELRLLWNFQGFPWTKFVCQTEWGTARIDEFGVYGNGAPQFSSQWRVDVQGKRREYADGEWVNDHFGGWFGKYKRCDFAGTGITGGAELPPLAAVWH